MLRLEDKTKIISFGKYSEENRKRKGTWKPETFEFLGFTHFCSQSKSGRFRVKRKTSGKKIQAKMKECKEWLKTNRTMNSRSVRNFVDKMKTILFKWMNRRSQRKSFNIEKFTLFLRKFPFPPKTKVNIYELREEISYIL